MPSFSALHSVTHKFHLPFLDYTNLDFSDYQIHVLTAVNKNFFRELPEPVLTFDLYDDFIRVTGRAQWRVLLYVIYHRLQCFV